MSGRVPVLTNTCNCKNEMNILKQENVMFMKNRYVHNALMNILASTSANLSPVLGPWKFKEMGFSIQKEAKELNLSRDTDSVLNKP